jgi:predicted RNA-binding protein Jag
MAQRSSFGKLQRDRAKKAKQETKRERRQERLEGAEEGVEIDALLGEDGKELSAADLLVLVEALHKQYDDKLIDLDTFEEKKADLMARLPID